MAKRKGNGRDAEALGLFHEMVDRLRAIESGQRDLKASTEHGFAEVASRLDRVEARLDNLRDLAGDQVRRLDERVSRIEAKLFGT